MASSIDATKPTAGNALTQDSRDNFSAAKSEIEALQTVSDTNTTDIADISAEDVRRLVWDTVVKTSGFTATAGVGFIIDTSGAAFTITMPASPTRGDIIGFVDTAGTFHTDNLTIDRNSSNIMGLSEDMTVDTRYVAFGLVFDDGTNGWRIL